MNRTITELTKLSGAVYVYVPNRDIEKKFLEDAEREGFSFGNGFKPTRSPGNDIYRIMEDMIMCHVNFFGHAAHDNKNIGSVEDCHYIDYARYVAGEDDYDDFREANVNAKTVLY